MRTHYPCRARPKTAQNLMFLTVAWVQLIAPAGGGRSFSRSAAFIAGLTVPIVDHGRHARP
jgi:hypothetical protein